MKTKHYRLKIRLKGNEENLIEFLAYLKTRMSTFKYFELMKEEGKNRYSLVSQVVYTKNIFDEIFYKPLYAKMILGIVKFYMKKFNHEIESLLGLFLFCDINRVCFNKKPFLI